MTKIVEEFRMRLRSALLMSGMTSAELSKKTGISEATLSQYKSGYSKPKDERLALLADALGVDPAWLKGFDVPMRRNDIALYDTLLITAKENGLTKAAELLESLGRNDKEGEELLNRLWSVAKPLNDDGLRRLIAYAEDIQDKYRKGEKDAQEEEEV